MHVELNELHQIAVARSPSELVQKVTRLSREHGFENWCYAVDLPVAGQQKSHFLLGNFPQAWLGHYFERDFLRVDPLVAHCHDHATPLAWPVRAPGYASDPRNAPALRMFNEAGEFGLRSGTSIPLHGLGCGWGIVSFVSPDPRMDEIFVRRAPAWHLLGHFVHEAAHRFAHATALPQPPHLTARELECLHWAAEGKTSWEIGRVLGVSERTVVFHLQNAAQKFGVRGRQSAVARAIALGLIDP